MSKALDVVRPSTNGKSKKSYRRGSLTDIDSDEGSNAGSLRFGTTPDDSLPALPMHYILDVTRKVQRNAKCPGCDAVLSHGLFSTARLCSYFCAYYCGKCHVGDEAVIPARLVHQLDVKPYPVCSEARGHIHQYYRSPQLDMKALNPAAYRYSSTLEKAGKLRRQLKYLGDYVKTCRNKETLLNLMDGRQYMLDSLNVYSLRDLIDALSGSLLPFMYNIMEKFIAHVTKTCMTCKGKGFYCEFCNSGDLLFSWMVLRSSECTVCPHCKSLAHAKCYKKGNGDCPKCKRIASLKMKTPAPISFLT